MGGDALGPELRREQCGEAWDARGDGVGTIGLERRMIWVCVRG